MVLGNFALLAGLSPTEVNEWIELPNISGMILFVDGGLLASKPYAASGSYINKMSNYCQQCQYKVTQKAGATDCPFNYLSWNFLIKQKNARLRMAYNQLSKFTNERVDQIKSDSRQFLITLK